VGLTPTPWPDAYKKKEWKIWEIIKMGTKLIIRAHFPRRGNTALLKRLIIPYVLYMGKIKKTFLEAVKKNLKRSLIVYDRDQRAMKNNHHGKWF